MSDELEPRPYTDRELTLTAISLTFQRARTVQRELTGAPTWTNPEPPPEPEGATTAELSDADLDDGPGDRPDDTGHDGRALGLDTSEEPDLPNPIVTDANLRHYLDQASRHQGLTDGRRGRLKPLGLNQTLYNAAVVHALHQLDHRTRLQQRTISRLEAELADARRALAALETNELREP